VAHDSSSWEQPRLSTDRLCLRTPTLHDAEALHELFADPEVMHGLNKEPLSGLGDSRAMIEGGIASWSRDGLGPFVLEAVATEAEVVGQAGLMIFDTRGWTPSTWADAGSHAQPELGWALIRRHWGNGYATEAAAAIRDWAYESRSAGRLVSLISPGNTRSQRVAERLGAVPAETVTPTDSRKTAVVWRHVPAMRGMSP
jgi:RimJ/RimL family protein N-acetyltransferase